MAAQGQPCRRMLARKQACCPERVPLPRQLPVPREGGTCGLKPPSQPRSAQPAESDPLHGPMGAHAGARCHGDCVLVRDECDRPWCTWPSVSPGSQILVAPGSVMVTAEQENPGLACPSVASLCAIQDFASPSPSPCQENAIASPSCMSLLLSRHRAGDRNSTARPTEPGTQKTHRTPPGVPGTLCAELGYVTGKGVGSSFHAQLRNESA